jgi:hypothetical protein
MYRISKDTNTVIDVAQVDQIGPVVQAEKSGPWHIDEISADPLPPGHTSRRWGVAIKRQDGSVVIQRDSWEA